MRAHRRQVKRLAALYPGHRIQVRRVSNRTPGVVCDRPFWRVYIVQTDVVRRVIGEGHSRREALHAALRAWSATQPRPSAPGGTA